MAALSHGLPRELQQVTTQAASSVAHAPLVASRRLRAMIAKATGNKAYGRLGQARVPAGNDAILCVLILKAIEGGLMPQWFMAMVSVALVIFITLLFEILGALNTLIRQNDKLLNPHTESARGSW